MPTTAITAELQINDIICLESRRFVAHALQLLDVQPQDGTVTLLVDELVANAAEAGATKVHIAIARTGRRIRVNVKDDARGSPEVRHPSPTDPRGRGLQILNSLTLDWGTYPLGVLKAVWFEYAPTADLDLRDQTATDEGAEPRDEPSATAGEPEGSGLPADPVPSAPRGRTAGSPTGAPRSGPSAPARSRPAWRFRQDGWHLTVT